MVLRKSFYIHWSAGRSPRVHEVNPGRDPSTAAGRAGIWPANPTAAAPFCHRIFVISGHFSATSGHPIAPFHHF